ncbi:hypothetical protein F1C10_08170 [Sphingomonas sp. NBWT7]|uniref:hypothetical protein n=1 Tax=Sphingomonas sp. NBWT7 TaxID=2596913 RepID=UPI0016244170|nr:hypothetical protein [Sphingomonas sp. NBWT7]QNE31912.1 hypothetical protein F1C10_08170 [Sphingomonas sp. NBWT7]
MRGPGSGALLGRAIARSAEAAGAMVAVEDCDTHPWYSATLSGARYAFALTADIDAPVAHWLYSLPQQDLPLPGHLVADLAVAPAIEYSGRLHWRIDALTIAAA